MVMLNGSTSANASLRFSKKRDAAYRKRTSGIEEVDSYAIGFSCPNRQDTLISDSGTFGYLFPRSTLPRFYAKLFYALTEPDVFLYYNIIYPLLLR